ncbi:MAG: hypothetical protein J2P17_02550, partial [Mycobacterium sp.]|nr:hypothetical protein [Mycobacterium sp.]
VSSDYDLGKAALDALIDWAEIHATEAKRNEATTRLHLINHLLMEVLRWDRSTIRAEEPAGSGRIDYAIGAPAIQLIVEAKKEGVYFDLPAGVLTGVHSIGSLTDGAPGRSLKLALEQVIPYAANRGVAPAVVTNGHQIVALLAARTDSIPPLDGRALVFRSLEDMRSDFRLLWDNLCPIAIDERRLWGTLRVTRPAPPDPLSARILNYPGIKHRNDLQAGLDILSELFLEDIARLEEIREDFLRDCYASSGALSQYAEVSKNILRTRYALLNAEESAELSPAEDKKGLSPHLTQDMLAAAVARRPIVLLGDVGVGKTTFIQRLVHVDAKEIFEQSFILYIDLGSTTTLGKIDSFVVDESIRQLWNHYNVDIDEATFVERVYRDEIRRFDSGVYGRLKTIDATAYEREKIEYTIGFTRDRAEHLKASLEHLRSSWHRQIVVFLDNIDQRSSEDQDVVFLISNELAQNWPATVFVTLRPETFHKSRRTGALSGYQPRVFTISPPRTDVVLTRRVDFALKQIRETGRLGSYPVNVTVDSDSLIDYLEMLAHNFIDNDNIKRLIDNLAGGNMRLALQFVTDFIGSGHVATRKILDIYRETGRYDIPVHEFLRALLYGDNEYYDSEASSIANLLRIVTPDGREHFLLPLLLVQLQLLGEANAEEGYVSAPELYSFAQGLGFEPIQINAAIDYAEEKRLLDSAPRYSEGGEKIYFRITTVGAYTVRVLLGYFSYLDAMTVDTPIVDENYRHEIGIAHTLGERLDRAEVFRIYLDKQWSKMTQEGLPWRWSDTSRRIVTDVKRVRKYAEPRPGGQRVRSSGS